MLLPIELAKAIKSTIPCHSLRKTIRSVSVDLQVALALADVRIALQRTSRRVLWQTTCALENRAHREKMKRTGVRVRGHLREDVAWVLRASDRCHCRRGRRRRQCPSPFRRSSLESSGFSFVSDWHDSGLGVSSEKNNQNNRPAVVQVPGPVC